MNSKGIAARNAYKAIATKYGTTKTFTGSNAKYPVIYAQEKYSGINVSDVADGTQVITGSVDTTAQSKMNPSGKTQNEDVYTAATIDTSKTDATSLTCTQTYYHMSSPSSYFNDSNFYSMIFGTGTNFWLASRCVNCDSKYSYADFGLRRVYRSVLNGNYLFYSFGSSNNDLNRLASAVSLGSGIQVKSGSGTESDPYIIEK